MWRGGTAKTPVPCKWAHCSLGSKVISLTALALAVEFQRLDNGVLDLLRGRPRWEKLGDSIFWYFELLHLVGLFLLHNGNECVFGQPFPLQSWLRTSGAF